MQYSLFLISYLVLLFPETFIRGDSPDTAVRRVGNKKRPQVDACDLSIKQKAKQEQQTQGKYSKEAGGIQGDSVGQSDQWPATSEEAAWSFVPIWEGSVDGLGSRGRGDPPVFVSVGNKGVRFGVSAVESTLTTSFVSVDFRAVSGGHFCTRLRFSKSGGDAVCARYFG